MAGRDLTLTPRVEDIRDKQPVVSVIEFDLAQIKERFDNNLASIRKQFDIAEALKAEGKIEECEIVGDHKLYFWKAHWISIFTKLANMEC